MLALRFYLALQLVSGSASVSDGVSSGWTLASRFEGTNFFDEGFNIGPPDQRNFVVWVNQSEAQRLGLYGVDNETGRAFIQAEHKEVVGSAKGRRAVRLQSKQQYSEGLFVFDAVHMPEGCGNHYAWWMTGPQWPNNGEIDIVECINTGTTARHTLHAGSKLTGTNCSMEGSNASDFSGHTTPWPPTPKSLTCGAQPGCEIISADNMSCGKGFNDLGTGGVFVTQFVRGASAGGSRAGRPAEIATWFFHRNEVPADLEAKHPDPRTWGLPYARHPLGINCTSNHFNKLWLTLSMNFCGWAGSSKQWDGAGKCGDITR
jgi:hypothetical protein